MQQLLNLDGSLVPFLPATLAHENTRGWYIFYHVFNPITAKLDRKEIKLNRIRRQYRTQMEFRAYVNTFMQQLNTKLAGGWTPFTQEENVRYYNTIKEIGEKFVAEKRKELTVETMRTYESFVRTFTAWVEKFHPGLKCIQFEKRHAVEFLDYIYNDHTFSKPKKGEDGKALTKPRSKKRLAALPEEMRTEKKSISATTYNNYIRNARTFFSWAVEKCYMKENPFMGMKHKEKEKKIRTLATPEDRTKIRNYFMENCPNFLIVAELVFNALIRPIEISRIRVGQVHLDEKVIRLDGQQTKTGYARDCVLSDELIEIISKALAPGYPDDYFLIGKGYEPGPEAMSNKMYQKLWARMRIATGIAETIQLYSLRDSGLTGLFDNGADANTVKQAADHHDLKITSIYCNHVDKDMVKKVRQHTPKF